MQCPSCKKKIPMSFKCSHCGAEIVRRSGSVSYDPVSHAAPPPMAPPPQDLAAPMEPPPMAPMAPMDSAPMEPPPMDEPTLVDAPPMAMAAAGAGVGAPAIAVENPYEAPDMMMPQPMYGDTQVLASPVTRLGAQFVDGFAAVGAYLPGVILAATADPGSGLATGYMLLSLLGLFGLGIYQMVLLSSDGQTIGKRVMKVRIVRYDDEGNPGFGRAVGLRAIVNGILGVIPLYALVDILFIFSGEHRCLHDYIAGTKVVTA